MSSSNEQRSPSSPTLSQVWSSSSNDHDTDGDGDGDGTSGDSGESQLSRALIVVAVKYAVLGIWSMISTLFVISMYAVSPNSVGAYLFYLDPFVSSLCLCLIHKQREKWYRRLCGWCDRCCTVVIVPRIREGIEMSM